MVKLKVKKVTKLTPSNLRDIEVGIRSLVLNPFEKLLLDRNKTYFRKYSTDRSNKKRNTIHILDSSL